MEMTGEYRISASRQLVWDALIDPEVLKSCLRGCEHMGQISENEFETVITTKVGPVKMTFKGAVELSDIDPPNGYTISGEGKGGAAGFARLGARVRLVKDGDVTVLSYKANATLGGKLAQMGARVVDGVARNMADEFFGCLAATVSPPLPDGEAEDTVPQRPPWLLPALGAGVAIVLVLLILFG
jgi:uncharacterized protein